MKVCIYLRKSRADEELEAQGENNTLFRHRNALLKYAKEKELSVIKIHEELVSGNELFFRPAMLELLKEVEQCLYDAVLCMDIDRLGRGDAEEQGLIFKKFKASKTRVITPNKTYDLDNETDEMFYDFQSFMARQEYRIIKRRMHAGTIRSVQEGNYNSPYAPYGYDIVTDKTSRTLRENKAQADVVRMIYKMYLSNHKTSDIVRHLNSIGLKSPRGMQWSAAHLQYIIKNPLYTGKIQWKKRSRQQSKESWKAQDVITRPRSEWILADGKHEGIVSKDDWNRAQEIMTIRYRPPTKLSTALQNPLAGLVYCGTCGGAMVRRPYKTNPNPHLMCRTIDCKSRSCRLDWVEAKLIDVLGEVLNGRIEQLKGGNKKDMSGELEKSLEIAVKNFEVIKKQKLRLYDLFEQGDYSADVFAERMSLLTDRIATSEAAIEKIKADIAICPTANILEHLEQQTKTLLESYHELNIENKNILLKSIVDRVTYKKEKPTWGNNFDLTIHLKI